MKYRVLSFLFLCTCTASLARGQTIAEKKASFHKVEGEIDQETQKQLETVNATLSEKRHLLKVLYEKALSLHQNDAPEQAFRSLQKSILQLKNEIAEIESMWRDETSTMLQGDIYALWHQPDTSLLQLVMDYGAQEFIYLVPPEIAAIRLCISSNLLIPRQSWGECLEVILSSHGVGVRQLNPFLRELYLIRQDTSGLKYMTSNRSELDSFSPQTRICFVLNPETPDPRSVLFFMQRFSNPATTSVHVVNGQILILSNAETVKELLKLYEFVKTGHRGHDYQLLTLTKLDAREMESILFSAFQYGSGPADEGSTLKVLPLSSLSQSLFLYGSKEEVSKAVKLIKDVESQIEHPQEKTVFWYTAKHSEAQDLAEVLAKVYDLLTDTFSNGGAPVDQAKLSKVAEEARNAMIVKPAQIEPLGQRKALKTADGQNNFIVDQKTGSIIMVVEQEALPKIKDLLKRLDVPKKMVQIEVLLFEKKISNQNKFGLNLLKVGSSASNTKSNVGLSWTNVGAGILEFLISHSKGSGIPAYDLAYNFLLGQEDVQINASPSVTTVNQTPATIAIVEEMSINTGNTVEKDKSTSNFSRAQYGITIQITPTINGGEEGENGEEELSYITLDTDITFDTTKRGANDRPDVTRRHIKNHVRIGDGQTVILGGLRRKSSQDNKESIPFLGEIPGIGKLFSTTDMSDNSTEMFVFITPKIIYDPLEDAERFKREELRKRPGDMPEFVHELLEAKAREKRRLFQGSLTALFGRHESGTASRVCNSKEYEGR